MVSAPRLPEPHPLRIAIVCTGVGRVKRGFERYFADLHRLLKGRVDITLFKGGGKSGEREKRIWSTSRVSKLNRILPLHRLIRRTPYHFECLTFAMGLYPRLRRADYDVVHCIDSPMARLLFKMRSSFGGTFRLLYTEGSAMPPADYPPADHAHHVAMQSYSDATRYGYSPDHMTLIPCGVESQRFETHKSRAELRSEYGIPANQFVILSVAAIDRRQKRTHYLIDEVVQLQGDYLLWLDGSFDHGDPSLIEDAKRNLGDRLRFTHVPSEKVCELYKLADVMVLASVHESFGLAVVEAMTAGLPVLVHDSPHFRWLVEDEESMLDMHGTGNLSRRLNQMMACPDVLDSKTAQQSARTRERFEWEAILPDYIELYRRVSTLPRLGSRRDARGEFFFCPTPSAPCQES